MSTVTDRWAAAIAYEDFMGRWSRVLAERFVAWLQIRGGVHWLDVGCGTGALTETICEQAAPASVTGCDPAEPFIAYARARVGSRASFVVAGTGALPRRADGFGSIASLLALNFFPEPEAALEEMRAGAAAHATISACVWDYGGEMQMLRSFWDAAAASDSGASALDEGTRFALCRPGALEMLFRHAGLADVRCEPLVIPTVFASFDDYWHALLGGTGPAPSYVDSLTDDQRTALSDELRRSLPRAPDATIPLTARAWAVRGTA